MPGMIALINPLIPRHHVYAEIMDFYNQHSDIQMMICENADRIVCVPVGTKLPGMHSVTVAELATRIEKGK
jgi:hypothetical protein